MAGRPGKFQPRFTGGMIDALMAQNDDVKLFETSAATLTNLRPLPQGGFTLVDGLRKIGRVRNYLTTLATSGTRYPVVIPGVGASATVLATLFLPNSQVVGGVDVLAFGGYPSGGTPPSYSQPNPPESPLIQGQIWVEYWNGSAWVQFAPSFALVDTLRNRRFALPPGQSVTTTQLRVVASVPTGADITLGIAYAWAETSQVSVARYRQFNVSSTLVYDLLFTGGGVDVYSGSTWVAALPFALSPAQVLTMRAVQQLATMVLTHQATPPMLIQRQGSSAEWEIHPIPFTKIPNYDFGDVVYTNFTPAKWTLTFVNFDTQLSSSTPPLPSGGAHFTISVNGVSSTAILQPSAGSYLAANWTATAAAIQAAILSIPGVAAGVTVTNTQVQANFAEFQVTMGGAANQGDGWAISGTVLDKADAAISAQKYQVGLSGGEPIMSVARGWPAACAIYQQRLALGGFAGVPLGILFAQEGNPFQLDTSLIASTSPFFVVLDGQGDETIVDLHLGRTLDVFTTYGEWWLQPGAVSKTTPPTFVYSTSNGISPTALPIETEGLTVFTHASEGVLLEYLYEYQFQNYSAKPISTQASSLVKGMVDNALQRATESNDTNLHHIVLASGAATLRATMREQDVNAFAQRFTDGDFLAVGVNALAEACFVVQRQVNGVAIAFFEKAEAGLWFDCAQSQAITQGDASFPTGADYVGATIWAEVDGYVQGPFTVPAGGVVALEFAAEQTGTMTFGRWTAPVATTLPLPREVAPRTVVRRPARAHTVRASVVNTTSLALSANGSKTFEVDLARWGAQTDVSPASQPYSGWTVMQGLPGYRMDVQVTITQLRPGALTVTGVTIEADL